MDQRARVIIGVLGVAVVALIIALVVVVRDDTGAYRMGGGMRAGNSYQGMMRAMGNMDSAAMLTQMRQALGEEDCQRMLQHMQDHRAGGTMMGNPQVDGMMHRMLDGMMQQMPGMPMNPSPSPTR